MPANEVVSLPAHQRGPAHNVLPRAIMRNHVHVDRDKPLQIGPQILGNGKGLEEHLGHDHGRPNVDIDSTAQFRHSRREQAEIVECRLPERPRSRKDAYE